MHVFFCLLARSFRLSKCFLLSLLARSFKFCYICVWLFDCSARICTYFVACSLAPSGWINPFFLACSLAHSARTCMYFSACSLAHSDWVTVIYLACSLAHSGWVSVVYLARSLAHSSLVTYVFGQLIILPGYAPIFLLARSLIQAGKPFSF